MILTEKEKKEIIQLIINFGRANFGRGKSQKTANQEFWDKITNQEFEKIQNFFEN